MDVAYVVLPEISDLGAIVAWIPDDDLILISEAESAPSQT